MPSYGAPSGDLASLVQSAPPLFIAKVAAVNEDGTVSLAWGAEPVLNVPCSNAYLQRDVDQVVLVARLTGGFIVLGTTAHAELDLEGMIDAAIEPMQDDLDAVTEHANELDDAVTYLQGVRPRLSYGTGNAPTGFAQADTVWFKDQGGGRVDLFIKKLNAGTGSTEPAAPTTTKTAAHARPVTLTANSRGSWRTSGQTDSAVLQGDWTGRGNWRGGWFYGSDIAAACAGKSVKSMTFYISRTNDGTGWNRGVPAHLALHNESSKSKPSQYGGVAMHSVRLSPGQLAKWEVPASWRSALASGDARGFMISGSGGGDYMKCASSSGKLIITFN